MISKTMMLTTFYGCENNMSSKKCEVLRIAFGHRKQ